MTHRQIINGAAAAIAATDGWETLPGFDFVGDSERPPTRGHVDKTGARSRRFLALAEAAFESITGDSPDYSGEEENK